MSAKTRTNFWIDVVIFICFLGVTFTGFILDGESTPAANEPARTRTIHSGLGLAIAVASLVHLVRHWDWWLNVLRRFSRLGKKVRVNFIIDCCLLVLFALITFTGLWLWLVGTNEPLRAVHAWSSMFILFTVITHIAMHLKWLAFTTRRMFTNVAVRGSTRVARQSNHRS